MRPRALALTALAVLLPLGAAHAQKSEWRTREMGVDIPARAGAVETRRFRCELPGQVFLSWSPAFRDREVEIRVTHHASGRLLLARRTCDGASLSFHADACLLERGERFDVEIRPVGRRAKAVQGKLFAQRRMRKD